MRKLEMPIKIKTLIPTFLVGGFVLWWYFKPFPWLGAVMGLTSGFLVFRILSAGRIERWRRPFFIALTALVLLTLIEYILFSGFASFMQMVDAFNLGYYFSGTPGLGAMPYPIPVVLPEIFWGRAEFIPQMGMWLTVVPTSLGAFFITMLPFFIMFILFGRAFCGWICPLGGLPEAMAAGRKEWWILNFSKQKTTMADSANHLSIKIWVDILRYGLLGLVVLLSLFLGFAIVNIFFPVLWLKSMPVFWIVIGMLAFFAVILPIMTKRRWWCFICPVGAILSPLERFSLFRIKIDRDKCVKCMDCVHACRMYALTPQGVEAGKCEGGYCIRCGRCVEACSEEAIDICWAGSSREARSPFITLAIATTFAIYFWYAVTLVSFTSEILGFR
jgi:ferredoxin-type protein NapH